MMRRRNPDHRGTANHRRTCHRKRRYRNEHEAQRAAAGLRRSQSYDGLPIRAYECSACRGWHVGHAREEAA